MKNKAKLEPILVFFMLLFPAAVFAVPNNSKIQKIETKEGFSQIEISWTKSVLAETESVVLIRKEGGCPLSPSDGEEIYRGNGEEFVDTGVFKEERYCYGAYVYDISGASTPMVIGEEIEKGGILAALGYFFSNNIMIGWGVVTIVVLFWIHKKTMKEKEALVGRLASKADTEKFYANK